MLIDNRQWWTIRHLLDCNGWILPRNPSDFAHAIGGCYGDDRPLDPAPPRNGLPLPATAPARPARIALGGLPALSPARRRLAVEHGPSNPDGPQHATRAGLLARLGRLPALAQVGYGHLPRHGRVPPARDLHRAAGLAARDR